MGKASRRKKTEQQSRQSYEHFSSKSIQKRIDHNIEAANSLSNPLVDFGLTAMTSFEASVDSGVEPLASPTVSKFSINFFRSPLPVDLQRECLSLFERNMGEFYRSSSWGLNLSEKDRELKHKDARLLVVSEVTDGILPHDRSCQVVAFSHFRFEPDDENHPLEEVMYIYEVQVDERVRGVGLGRRLMSVMELIAMRQQMRRVVLTVFKSNVSAMRFYLKTMKYVVDASSPSQYKGEHNDTADYEILSKRVWKGT